MTLEEFQNSLTTLVMQFQAGNYDARHLLLDRSDQILKLAVHTPVELPEHLKTEWQSICAEVKEIQPTFKSHHKTSILFDRQGMGQPGVQRAKTLITRIVALTKTVERIKI